MKNLKNSVLNSLQSSKEIDSMCANLKKYQRNLINNHDNPVFSKDDKKKILKLYSDLQKIGKSLYRYNKLTENEEVENAQTEKENIENVLLKGSVSNTKYIWHSELGEHTCIECSDLDGQEFDFYEEVPERPHPNCKCYVEIIEIEEENSSNTDKTDSGKTGSKKPKEEDPCDCWDKIDAMVDEVNSWQEELEQSFFEINDIEENDLKLLDEIKNFRDEVLNLQSELNEIEPCGENCVAYITGMAINITDDKELENIFSNLIDNIETGKQVFNIFLEYKHEMEEAKDGMDKYYHSKANCTSAELGLIQTLWATAYSALKEVKDYIYKVFKYHMDFKVVAKDCWQDLKADLFGLIKASSHESCSYKPEEVNDFVYNTNLGEYIYEQIKNKIKDKNK